MEKKTPIEFLKENISNINCFEKYYKLFKKINRFLYSLVFVRPSKENFFLPSLKKQDDYVAFIINNNFTNDILKYDIYNGDISLDELINFLPNWVIERTVKKRIPTQTDHELAIIYGLPSNMFEGIMVGRIIERDLDKIEFLKNLFPDCYICNVDGKVIR